MALSQPRKSIVRIERGVLTLPVAALASCIQGGLAILAGGYVRPGRAGQGATALLKAADAATYQAVGVFTESVTGGAAAGDVSVKVQAGIWNFRNSAGADAIAVGDIGRAAYIVDDETVALTSAGGVRALAGRIESVDSEGVWVNVGVGPSRGRSLQIPFQINETDTLAGTSVELVSPVGGVIASLSIIVQKAVTTGGPVTASVDGVAVNGLSVTIADAATKGTVVSDTPTVGHASTVVGAGSRIQVIPDAAFATAGALNGFIEIQY